MNREERKELLLSIEENQLLDDLFEHPGMRFLLGKLQGMHDANKNLETINTMEQLHFKRGENNIILWFLSCQNLIKHTLVGLVEDAERETALNRVESLIDEEDRLY